MLQLIAAELHVAMALGGSLSLADRRLRIGAPVRAKNAMKAAAA